ncbi:MAG: metallophosphoesterase [Planctomycetes bacterium]|nr:metallophosphoesterase [Planctomycetota bacterium]
MRLIVTSDLHYNVLRSRQPTIRIAEQICGLSSRRGDAEPNRADALLILGDAAGQDTAILRDCLHLFDSFAGRKLFVPGNHDIWTTPDGSSLDRYQRVLPEICREAGFHMLDVEPVVLGNVGLVGCMGWYDFSFRPRELGIPLRFYQEKIAPGAAARMDRYAHLLESTHDVPEETLRMGTRWLDGEYVHLPMTDEEFCGLLLRRLDEHLARVVEMCETIVVGLHHVPFRELMPLNDNPTWAFGRAFLGSEALGELLLRHPKVRHVYCGHTHKAGQTTRGRIQCINTGCTYTEKRYELLEL